MGITADSRFSLEPHCRQQGRLHEAKAVKAECTPEDICKQTCGEGFWLDTDAAINQIATKLVTGWMRSPGHRANILTGTFTHTAVAVVEGKKHFTDKDGKDWELPA